MKMNDRIYERLACEELSTLRRNHSGIGRTHRVVFVLGALFAFWLMAAPQVHANTLTACTSGCTYQGTTAIQEAINAASPTSTDTICIQGTITERNIEVDKSLIIEGESDTDPNNTDCTGSDTTIVDGGSSSSGSSPTYGRVFTIDGGVTVTIRDLTIQNGRTTQNGGAINNSGTLLEVDNCTFTDNYANFYSNLLGGKRGGAIANNSGQNTQLKIENSKFSGNQASWYGGAVWNEGYLSVDQSTFQNNSAITQHGIGGGAISNVGLAATATISNSTLSGNHGDEGGAIYNSSGAMLTVTKSTISGNYFYTNTKGAQYGNFEGGGIYNSTATLTVTDSTFSENQSRYGGAIYNTAGVSPYSFTATVTNSTFYDNFNRLLASGSHIFSTEGAAIMGATEGTLDVTFSTFSGNLATYGGAIFVTNDPGRLTVANLKSSIFAQSPSSNCDNDSGDDVSYQGVINDMGYNISDDSSCNFSISTLVNTDPMLDPNGLQLNNTDNTGTTETIALQSDSPAIDAVPYSSNTADSHCTDQASPPNSVGTDQRGVTRPQGAGCDIGAFELIGDTSPPDITINTPVEGDTYTINQAVRADYSCSETPAEDNDTITCEGKVTDPDGIVTPVVSENNTVTSKIGTYTFTVDASDQDTESSTNEKHVTYKVIYAICALYDQNKSVESGATIPIKLQLCDANGVNLSSAGISLQATGVIPINDLENAGNSNPGSYFRYDPTLGGTGGYIFNLKTTGYASGLYQLEFTVGTDPTVYTVGFGVK